MAWNNEKIKLFIKEIEKRPVLWDVAHDDYKNKSLKNDAINEVATLVDCEGIEVARKWRIIMSQYRRELQKVKQSKSLGVGGEAMYKPVWFAFKYLSFVGERGRDQTKPTIDSFPSIKHAQADDMDPNCIYQPTLWYYNLLSFTFNQEMPLYCVSKVEEEDGDDEDMRHENQYEPEYIFSEDPASPHKLRPDSPLSSGSNKHPENRKRIIEPDIFTLAKQYDEFDAIAISIAAKLRKINERNEDQRYMCEKIINDALLKGLFNKLSEDSVIGEIINENQYNNLLSIPPSSNTNNNPLRNCVFVKDT